MRVSVRDNVKAPHQPRREYLSTQVEDLLARFAQSIHQVDVTVNQEGHNAATTTHCHLTACLGSLGVVVAEWRDVNEHHAFKGAVARLIRGIGKRVGKRQDRRIHVDAMQEAVAVAG